MTTKTTRKNQKLGFALAKKAAGGPKPHLPTVVAIFASIFFLAASRSFATVWPSDGTETGHNYPGGSVQWVHDNQAQNGDTITLPVGSFSWTAKLGVTKGITLQGQTAIVGAGTATPIIVDSTVIVDETPFNTPGLIDMGSSQPFRITGHNTDSRFAGANFERCSSESSQRYIKSVSTS